MNAPDVELDVPVVEGIHKAATEIRASVKECASTLADEPDAGIRGLLINDALARTQQRFAEKADWCARRWENFAWAIDATVKDMRAVDKTNALRLGHREYRFVYPPGGPGVRD